MTQEVVPDVVDGRGFHRGRPENLRIPPDFSLDVSERTGVAADDEAGFLGLDDDLADVRVEFEVGDTGIVRDELSNRGFRFAPWCLGAFRWTNRDSFPYRARQPTNESVRVGELAGRVGIDDQFRAFVDDP